MCFLVYCIEFFFWDFGASNSFVFGKPWQGDSIARNCYTSCPWRCTYRNNSGASFRRNSNNKEVQDYPVYSIRLSRATWKLNCIHAGRDEGLIVLFYLMLISLPEFHIDCQFQRLSRLYCLSKEFFLDLRVNQIGDEYITY